MLGTKQILFYDASICWMHVNAKKGRNQKEDEDKQAMQIWVREKENR